MNKLTEINLENVERARNEAHATYKSGVTYLIVSITIGVIIGVTLTLVINSVIVGPVNAAIMNLTDIAASPSVTLPKNTACQLSP